MRIKTFSKENIPLFKLKDSFRTNSKILEKFMIKNFFYKDWFQIYIKPEYRNSGLATKLLHFVEEDLLLYQLKDYQIPLIVGKGLAYDLIK